MYRNVWRRVVAFGLIVLGLAWYPFTISLAQAPTPAANSPVGEDDASIWEEAAPAAPFVPKPESVVTDPDKEDKQVEPLEQAVFIPYLQAGVSHPEELQAAAIDAPTWQTIVFEGFDAIFVGWPLPGGKWTVADYNGSQVPPSNPNTLFLWDDTATKAFAGSKSAHPTDGPPYINHTHTYMQYGPFSLVGALDAKLTFHYWLDSELNFDFFRWEYSCNGTSGNWAGGMARSGFPNEWTSVTTSLKSCLDKSNVYVRFWFVSDYNVSDNGVWVDSVKIERLNPL
jgi:hypothetical protein